MSIVNVFLRGESALVGVDTEGTTADGNHVQVCKLIMLPHMSAVVAFRGFNYRLASAAPLLVAFGGDFDDLLTSSMSKIVNEAMRLSDDALRAHGHIGNLGFINDEDKFTEFVLVGYSHKSGRTRGKAFKRRPEFPDVVEGEFQETSISPYWTHEDFWKLNIQNDAAGMEKLSLDQMRIVRARERPGSPAGGRLLIVEVRKDGLTAKLACEFPSRPNS